MIIYKPFDQNDVILVGKFEGRVLSIDLRYTVLDYNGRIVYVPNSKLFVDSIVVDDDVRSIEGDWHGSRLVILEFDDEEAFRDWYDSPEYQAALPLRLSSTDSRGALAKGLG